MYGLHPLMHIGYITKYINHQVPKNTKPIQILISKITKLEKLNESKNIIGQKNGIVFFGPIIFTKEKNPIHTLETQKQKISFKEIFKTMVWLLSNAFYHMVLNNINLLATIDKLI